MLPNYFQENTVFRASILHSLTREGFSSVFLTSKINVFSEGVHESHIRSCFWNTVKGRGACGLPGVGKQQNEKGCGPRPGLKTDCDVKNRIN